MRIYAVADIHMYMFTVVGVTRPPENTTVCRGSDVTISCGYNSTILLGTTLLINGTSLRVTDYPLLYRQNNLTIPLSYSLTIFAVNFTTTFQCAINININASQRIVSLSTLGTVTVDGMYICTNVHGYVHMYVRTYVLIVYR